MSDTLPAKPSGSTANVKRSKFKPAITGASKQDPSRRPGLGAFSTPGFQVRKDISSNMATPLAGRDVISISSDSAPSTPAPNGVKRQSSGFSIPENLSPPVKRLKKSVNDEKENILSTSFSVNVNPHVPRPVVDIHSPLSDLASMSIASLTKCQIYALEMSRYISKECLAFHDGSDTCKDITLLKEMEKLVTVRLENIRRRIDHLSQPNVNHNVATSTQRETHRPNPDMHLQDTITRSKEPNIVRDDAASDDGYWEGLEDIPANYEPPSTKPVKHVIPDRESAERKTENLTTTQFYPEVFRQLHSIFKLPGFRHNQLEAITATLEGKDVFVLMPTGGGKSLCYQLPAVCSTGKTAGVSVVVSPLLSLMKDQVSSLIQKDIDALLSNAETGNEDWTRLVVQSPKPKLWYITPEKLRDSAKVNDILARLHRDRCLARFVIDEAHCISTWGQDFRDAYTALGLLREKYPDVPMMALTATANKRTILDIVSQLNLRQNHVSFTQSFNRTNLSYTVKLKHGDPFNDIVNFINNNHPGHAGIIYCQSRVQCEKVAEKLRGRGLPAAHFHAGLSNQEKDDVFDGWQTGQIFIIVATIAFGMGIDKADVRFVIHRDMPKTLSGYYQETGRAGRDGKHADCLMFYSGNDVHKLQSQIEKTEESTPESKKRQMDAVREVYEFCKKISVCRRVQLLRHFDEDFNAESCNEGCDNCQDVRQTVSEDVTPYVQSSIRLAKRLEKEQENTTLSQFRSILLGSRAADIIKKGHDKLDEHGSCQRLPKELLDLMLDELIYLGVVTKDHVKNGGGFFNEYISVGDVADNILSENRKVMIVWRPTPGKASEKEPRQRKKAVVAEYSVSAPVRSRKGKKKAIEDDPIISYDDMYDDDFDASGFDSIPELNHYPLSTIKQTVTAEISTSPITTRAKTKLTLNHLGPDPVQTLYKKMIALRDEIMLQRRLNDPDEVFNDNVLQFLSATCPTDYNSFKQQLILAIDMEGPLATDYANSRWPQFGQQFLQLCISHKTVALEMTGSIAPAPQAHTPTTTLPSQYMYQPLPAGSSSSVSTASYRKFKPAGPR